MMFPVSYLSERLIRHLKQGLDNDRHEPIIIVGLHIERARWR